MTDRRQTVTICEVIQHQYHCVHQQRVSPDLQLEQVSLMSLVVSGRQLQQVSETAQVRQETGG